MPEKREKKCRDPIALCEDFYRLGGGVWSETRLFREEGVAVLEWKGSFPAPTAEQFPSERARQRVGNFYARLALAASEAVRTQLLPIAVRAYRENDDARKKFRHRRFRLIHEASVTEENGDILSIKRRLLLFRGGKLLYAKEEAEVFSLKSGVLLSLREAKRLFPKDVGKHPSHAPFYIENGEICFIEQQKAGPRVF